uniref:Methyltetrahydrofolate:corrinoid/iron-sulfur protein methyltransferase n=1 Tax=uncultured organism TaxID=155900 RepID=M1Q0U4_9ZZZZ|nr:methyltetrahydrofolate:corrinoid/iron-sulfur protein methyltransferase [uncultured organism]
MILIAERINTGFSEVKNALENRDPAVIKELARKQTDAGADYLDISLGAASKDPEDMVWLVEAVQDEVDTGLCIDAQKREIVEPALQACEGDALINSTTAQEEKMEELIPLAADYGASIIGVTSDEDGSPQDVAGRLQLASTIFRRADSAGLEPDDLFIDPVAMPLKYMQEQASNLLEAISQLKNLSDPRPHLSLGLSNMSSEASERSLINRTFLVMAMASGLDAAICDVLDEKLINSVATAEMVLNNEIYSDSFVETYRMD